MPTTQNGPYRRSAYDETEQTVVVEITEVPPAWRQILNRKRPRTALVAALAALLGWIAATVSAITTFAR